METIRGRKSHELDLNGLEEKVANYNRILLDLGTGDGRYAQNLAATHPDWFVLGMDSCRENLRDRSQAKLQNLLFVIASAQSLPCELEGLISHLTINFPWGSLLESLLAGDSNMMRGLEAISRVDAAIDLRLNGGALVEAGSTLESGTHTIYDHLHRSGWQVRAPVMMNSRELRAFPSTWAKRLAFGRDPRATMVSAHK